MNNIEYYVIGVMSGTSLDGIDLCYMKLTYRDEWNFKILKADTIKYNIDWKNKLSNAILLDSSEVHNLDVSYSLFLSELISKFIQNNNINKDIIVCSHGHTVFHQPDKGKTLQIGNQKEITTYLDNTVVCDFRVQDVKLGGQGAPLVPIGDKLLFHDFDFCLNLGGFANISFDDNNNRIAFDICPVNIVLNYYCEKLGLEYDNNGEISKSGKINKELLNKLNSLEYYRRNYPKSLGLEWVKKEVIPIIECSKLDINTVLRTYVEHIAIQVFKSTKGFNKGRLLVSGGGAFNKFLMERISKLTQHEVVIPKIEIINYKEALIFGLLGVLKLRNEVNCLSSVTGVTKNHSSGKIFQ